MRVHRRADTLRIVFSELRRYRSFKGVAVLAHVMQDRPSQEVKKVLADNDDLIYNVLEAPFPLVSAAGERFCEGLNLQLDDFERAGANFYMLQDDDSWLEPGQAQDALEWALEQNEADMLYVHSVFFWDVSNLYNSNRRHCSPLLFRALPGDRYPLNRMITATEHRHDTAIAENRTSDLGVPMLDYGTYSAADRQEVWERYAEAGKVDEFTKPLLQQPKLMVAPLSWKLLYPPERN